MMIRAARPDDLCALRELERAAGAAFRDVAMAAVADDEPPSLAELARFQQDGRAWVAAEAGAPVAYLLAEVIDAGAHIEQVSVHPSHARRGLGSALIDAAADWAAERRMAALTLTTFAEVPWNAPYYERLGFRVLAQQELTAGLRRIVAREAAAGLARWPRVAMARPVDRRRGGTQRR